MAMARAMFRVDRDRPFRGNTQYAVFFFEDRMLFASVVRGYPDTGRRSLIVLGATFGLAAGGLVALIAILVFGSGVADRLPESLIIFTFYSFAGICFAIGGIIGGLLGALFGSRSQRAAARRRDEKMKALREMSPQEILQTEKNSFELRYDDIKAVEMKRIAWLKGTTIGLMAILREKRLYFSISPNQSYEECERIVSTHLPNKLQKI